MKQEDKELNFQDKIKKLYPDIFSQILDTHKLSKPKTFRVNTLISNKEDALKDLNLEGYEYSEVFENAYICIKTPENKTLAQSKAFNESKIYIQELSSMMPAVVLEPLERDKILDFCAAPGSKTGQLANLTKNRSEIIAIEKGRDRFFKMKELLKNQLVDAKCYLEDANIFPKRHQNYLEYFDKILVDVPCTNEGGIDLAHPGTLKFWSEKEAKKISKVQKGLLNNALKLLKKGGVLVYSTCTYSAEENEIVVDWALKRWPKAKLVDFDIPTKNWAEGRVEWEGKTLNPALVKTKRIIPSENWNAFYIAKIVKE